MALADERFAVLGDFFADFFADFLDDLVLQPSSPCNARSFVVLVSFATLEIFDALEALARFCGRGSTRGRGSTNTWRKRWRIGW